MSSSQKIIGVIQFRATNKPLENLAVIDIKVRDAKEREATVRAYFLVRPSQESSLAPVN